MSGSHDTAALLPAVTYANYVSTESPRDMPARTNTLVAIVRQGARLRYVGGGGGGNVDTSPHLAHHLASPRLTHFFQAYSAYSRAIYAVARVGDNLRRKVDGGEEYTRRERLSANVRVRRRANWGLRPCSRCRRRVFR